MPQTSDRRPAALKFPDGRTPRIALALQGGGALGAYQVGVYQALEEAGVTPDWVAGISIGAVNAALIVGNKPEQRLERLTEFWQTISRPDLMPLPAQIDLRRFYNATSANQTMLFGQPGFFKPRLLNPWFAPAGTPGAVSFYDTAPLADTLARLIDFDQLNSGATRLTLGAANVETGEQITFDTAYSRIGPEHIMASGALPPGFPPVQAGVDLCWDGGVVSNAPVSMVLDDQPRQDTLCFMVDLFDPVGPVPRTMSDVLDRQKEIAYASRNRHHIESFRATHDLRRAVNALAARLPKSALEDPEIRRLAELGCVTTMNIVHLLYRSRKYETGSKDYEFSRASIAEHRAIGYRDTCMALTHRPWFRSVDVNTGVVIHDVVSHEGEEAVISKPAAAHPAAGRKPRRVSGD